MFAHAAGERAAGEVVDEKRTLVHAPGPCPGPAGATAPAAGPSTPAADGSTARRAQRGLQLTPGLLAVLRSASAARYLAAPAIPPLGLLLCLHASWRPVSRGPSPARTAPRTPVCRRTSRRRSRNPHARTMQTLTYAALRHAVCSERSGPGSAAVGRIGYLGCRGGAWRLVRSPDTPYAGPRPRPKEVPGSD